MLFRQFRSFLLDKTLYRIQVRWRMIIYYLALILIPFAMAAFFFNRQIVETEAEKKEELLGRTISAGQILEQKVKNIEGMLRIVLNIPEVSSVLEHGPSTADGWMLSRTAQACSSDFTAGGAPFFLQYWWEGDAGLEGVMPLKRHPMCEALKKLKVETSLIVDDAFMLDSELEKGVSFFQVRSKDGRTCAAQLFVRERELTAQLEQLRPTPMSEFYVLNGEGVILAGTRNGVRGVALHGFSQLSAQPSAQWDGIYGNQPMLYSAVRMGHLSLVLLTPQMELESSLQEKQILLICFGIWLVLGGAVLLCSIYKNISEPLQLLAQGMQNVNEGRMESIAFAYRRKDEFSGLMERFQEMVAHIQCIIDEMLQLEKTKRQTQELARESEIRALQAMINPHMLYNTLDIINWLALKRGARDISRVICNLANFFRYSLSKGKDYITFAEEFKQIDSYLSIQKLRFYERMDYQIDFPEELMGCYTLKLILQPFVENCVVHAFTHTSNFGFIRICGRQKENDILLTIEDNGVGADVEKLQAILGSDDQDTKHYGMRNVAERLRLCFGERYTVRFARNAENGLTVSILLPIIRDREECS